MWGHSQTLNDSRNNLNGIWWFSSPENETLSPTIKGEYPLLKGIFLGFRWDSLQPKRDVFNWKMLDENLYNYANAGIHMNIALWVGPFSPQWLYDAKTPGHIEFFRTDDEKSNRNNWIYPDYKDPNYKMYWYKMIDAVAAHLSKMPKKITDHIYVYESAEGTTNDAIPYHGEPYKSNYAISDEEWLIIREDAWKYTDYALYKKNNLPQTVHLRLNPSTGILGNIYINWVKQNLPNAWYKIASVGQAYQLNDEKNLLKLYDPLINIAKTDCKTLSRARSELNTSDYSRTSWFKQDSVWNYYWTHLSALYFGLDANLQFPISNSNKDYRLAFEIFSKYAGYKNPNCSPGAFCALRDGLDAADTVRFSAKEFGRGTPGLADNNGINRCKKIAQKFAAYGALQQDPPSAQGSAMNQQKAVKMNDVGWNIFSGNYEKYLTQLYPETSIGYWRYGPHTQPYGRFARGFKHQLKKDTLYFNVNDNLFDVFPLNGRQPVYVRVVYFDGGFGKWALYYDAKGNNFKKAYEVKNSNSNRWVEKVVKITDAYFGNKSRRKADLLLVNTDNNDEVFHMVEVVKNQQNTIASTEQAQSDNDNKQKDLKAFIKVFPNPFTSIVNVKLNATTNEPAFISITDMYGNVRLRKKVNAQSSSDLNVSFLKPGFYQLQIYYKDKNYMQKLIKQ